VSIPPISLIYFFYGLAFFSMGLLVMVEGGRSLDARPRRALRPLAAFGLVHAANEWIEMYEGVAVLLGQPLPGWISPGLSPPWRRWHCPSCPQRCLPGQAGRC
jgi:hypothetical protein